MDYLRNRIRNQYLPSLEKENPKFRQALQHLGQESQQLFQAIQDLTAEIDVTDCSQFLAQTTAVQAVLFKIILKNFLICKCHTVNLMKCCGCYEVRQM